ncbi:hypothetical protein MAP00_008444 [Monascus purpureus]|nr:hypothetical protein MAP00_008444 [Monascus purpureus]
MTSQPFSFRGPSQSAPDSLTQSSAHFSFRVIVPSIETADDDLASSRGQVQSPSSGSEDRSQPVYTPSRGTATPCQHSSSSLSINRYMQAFTFQGFSNSSPSTGLSPGQSTSTYADLYNATPEPTTHRGTTFDTADSLAGHLRNLPLDSDVDNDEISDTRSDEEADTDTDDASLFDVRHERLPRARIYNAGLQTVLLDVKNQLSALHDDMGRYPLSHVHDSDLSELYRQVHKLSEVECPETRTVGFIGDSGAGKSSVINSLLDKDGLARSSGDGAACTSVVTEFRNVDARHPDRYTIEVDYMNAEEVRELLEELLQSFRMFSSDLFREEEDNSNVSVEEMNQIRERSERAWSTLKSMFRDRPDLTREFLCEQGDGALSRIVETLKEWADSSIMQRPGGASLQHTIIARNCEECKSELDSLTMDPSDDGQIAVWPFIKLIRVYLRSPVLRTGLVLADLPGFRDLNFARIRATERYLRHSCNEVFVVTAISRCVTDPSIDEIRRRCTKGQPLRIVCTRSEDINATERARHFPEIAAQVTRLKERVDSLNRKLARLQRPGHTRKAGDGKILQYLWVSSPCAQQSPYVTANDSASRESAEDAKLELDRFLIQDRNQRVTKQLSKHGAEVRIFCVSNRLYSDHQQSGRRQADAYIELSGIRNLRQYCQLVPAEAQFQFVAAFLEHRVPAVVNSVRQWAIAGEDNVTTERAAALRQVLLDVERVFRERLIGRDSEIQAFSRRLEDRYETDILNIAQARLSEWKRSALQASMVWETWYHSTYAAFCRKNGTHSTGAAGYHCWNDELLEAMRTDLEEKWNAIEISIHGQIATLRGAVRRAFEESSKKLNDSIQLAPIALGNLVDNMSAREACITTSIRQSLEKLTQESSRVMMDALYGHAASSYMAGLMRPAYNLCNSEGGRGSDARRKGHMRLHLTSSNIFDSLIDSMEADRRNLAMENYAELNRTVSEEVRNICNDLHSVVAEEGEVAEATRFPELATSLRRRVQMAQQTLTRAQRIVGELRHAQQ